MRISDWSSDVCSSDLPEIVATDVSDAALTRAREGRYSQFEIQRGLPVRRMMQWFARDGADWVARPELVRQVQFRRQNLVGDPPPEGSSAERRVGKACVRTCRSRWSPSN